MPAPDDRGMMCFDTPIPCCRPSPRGTRRPCDGSVPVGGDGVPLPAGAATARDVLLQAYSDPGRYLSILIELHTAAVLSTHRTGLGDPVSRHCRHPTRAAGTPLYRGRVPGANGELLTAGEYSICPC